MDLVGDVGQMEAPFGPFVDNVNLHAKWVHSLYRTYNGLGNHFGHTRWNSLVMLIEWKLILVCLEIVLTSIEHRCTVWDERTISSEIVWEKWFHSMERYH
jgi:hypothetical protein